MRTLARLLAIIILAAATGCTSTSIRYLDAEAGPTVLADHWSLPATNLPVEDTYTTVDGAELAFLAYRGRTPARMAVVYLHGIESHAGWFDAAARGLRGTGFDVFCLDRRGSGINRENRGFPSGHVDRFDLLIADVKVFVGGLRRHYDEVVLCGLSWGGKYALTYANTHPPTIDGLVLITPGTYPLVDLTFDQKMSVAWNDTLGPMHRIPTPIEPEMFTTDPVYLQIIIDDPLRLHEATARFFMESRRMDGYLEQVRGTYPGPILLILADDDRIIDNAAVERAMREDHPHTLKLHTYEGQTHSVQYEATDRLVRHISGWYREEVAPRRRGP